MSCEEPTATDDEWVWEEKLVGRRVGTQYGRSRDADGTESPNLFVPGARGVKTQVKIRDIHKDDDDRPTSPEPVYIYVNDADASDSEVRTELQALFALAVLGAIFAAPHVRRWWGDQLLPFLRKTRAKLSKSSEADSQVVAAESSALTDPAPAVSLQEVLGALEKYRASMSSAEARDRFVAALVARLFSDEQFRLLRNARIEDEVGAVQLASAMETLTPQQLAESMTLMLEANPSWPDEKTLNELGKVLGGRHVDGEGVPVGRAGIKRALPPPASGE